jgi:hypothetical protein
MHVARFRWRMVGCLGGFPFNLGFLSCNQRHEGSP